MKHATPTEFRVPPVDAIALETRAAELATRSIKKESKRHGLLLALRMTDLTTLEGRDSIGKVRGMCRKAVHPAPGLPSVAAVCVYPDLVRTAVETVAGSGVAVASVATGFPSGRTELALKLEETQACVEHGANEIDMVIDRGAFLSGNYGRVFDEICRVKEACGDAHLKVILETGRVVGVKAAGGISKSKDALRYLVMVNETVGDLWMHPNTFRFGASSLLNDLLMQLARLDDGHYQRPEDFSRD